MKVNTLAMCIILEVHSAMCTQICILCSITLSIHVLLDLRTITLNYSTIYFSIKAFTSFNSIRTDDKPSLLDLMNFPGKYRKFDVMEEIGIKYSKFGILLLQDADGSKVAALELTWQRDSNQISRDIMKDWLQGRGKRPVTYATLLGCLRDAGLNSLATDIEDTITMF